MSDSFASSDQRPFGQAHHSSSEFSRQTAGEVKSKIRDRIAATLRLRLLTLEYRPGQLLVIEDISKEFNVSRTPVTQAFGQLANESLVDIIPRMGVMVAALSPRRAQNLFEARLNAECLSVRLAVERGTSDEVAKIVELANEIIAVKNHNLQELMINDRAFHQAIAVASHNPVLSDFLRGIHDQFLRHCFLDAANQDPTARVQRQHIAIGEAIASRDTNKAEALAQQHIASSRAFACSTSFEQQNRQFSKSLNQR